MKNILRTLLSLLFLTSCSGIKKEQITVINGIVLGQSTTVFYHSLDSLGLKSVPFYTKQLFYDVNDVEKSKVKDYITEIFNLSDYRDNGSQHWGLIYPISNAGTDKITGVNVILCNASGACIFKKSGFTALTKSSGMLGLSQVLSTSLVDDVKSMLISKYGQPKDTLDYDFNSFFILEGNQVNSYKGTDKIKGKVYSWETEFLDIKIFEGILNVGTTYVSETKSYLKPIFPHDLSIQTPKTALSPGETHCFSYPYIQYKLNENAIKLLKLDVPNL